MAATHPLATWAVTASKPRTIAFIAGSAGCSESHLRNIIAGRKEPSLGLAKKLSTLTDGVVPIEAFLLPKRGLAARRRISERSPPRMKA